MLLKLAYTWRGFLVAPPVVVALVCLWGEYERDLLVWPLGLLVFLAGWAMRLWAQQYICYRLKTAKILVTDGPYALVRNPIYIGNTLVVLGLVCMSEVLWMVPGALLWCAAAYSLVVRYEERRLTARYGAAYLAYTAVVRRWLPRLQRRVPTGARRATLYQALLAEVHVGFLLVPVVLKEVLVERFFG
jgi:protein-S-isoprenylcysteine O-methyltransferase Ste14